MLILLQSVAYLCSHAQILHFQPRLWSRLNLDLVLAGEVNILVLGFEGLGLFSLLSFSISCLSLLCTHVTNWYTYVCRVRRCKPIVNNHVSTSRGNEREK